MNKIITAVFATVFAISIAACSDNTKETATKQPAPQSQVTSAKETMDKKAEEEKAAKEAKAAQAKAEEERRNAQAAEEQQMRVNIEKLSIEIEKVIDGAKKGQKMDLGMIQSIVQHVNVYPGSEYLGTMYHMWNSLSNQILNNAKTDHYGNALRELIITRVIIDRTGFEKLFESLVPYLQAKTDLVSILRKNRKILATPWSSPTNAKVLECIQPNPNQATMSDEQINVCKAEFKRLEMSFEEIKGEGGKATFLRASDDNAVYILKFLNRRAGNDGDTFAQFAQKLALKLVK